MSYAIIRNTNYKFKNLPGIYRHNERKNSKYSNEEIDKEKSKDNYSIKYAYSSYRKIFDDLREKYNLKGQVKIVSNVMCEVIITSDKEFFDSIRLGRNKKIF